MVKSMGKTGEPWGIPVLASCSSVDGHILPLYSRVINLPTATSPHVTRNLTRNGWASKSAARESRFFSLYSFLAR